MYYLNLDKFIEAAQRNFIALLVFAISFFSCQSEAIRKILTIIPEDPKTNS